MIPDTHKNKPSVRPAPTRIRQILATPLIGFMFSVWKTQSAPG
jgi:hypothetical protein